jgi:hypothetical protein
MPGSLKEQSIPLEFAKFESINDLFDHLIWRWNFKNQSRKYAMRHPSPKMKKNIFERFSGLIKKQVQVWNQIYEKSHLLVRGCVIVGKQFAQPIAWFYFLFFPEHLVFHKSCQMCAVTQQNMNRY